MSSSICAKPAACRGSSTTSPRCLSTETASSFARRSPVNPRCASTPSGSLVLSIDEPDDPFPDLQIHLIAGRDVSPEAGGPGCPAAPGLPSFGCDRRAAARDEHRRLLLLIALVE